MKKYLLLLAFTIATQTAFSQATRLVLFEHFTQASCGPCASQNPPFAALLATNTTKAVKIAYQTSWPGVDPMNAANPTEVLTRRNYYGVTGVPNVRNGATDHSSPTAVTQSIIDARYNVTPEMAVILTHQLTSGYDSVQIAVSVSNPTTSTVTSGSANSLKLHIALVEETINYSSPPGSNGEMVFHNVMRKMVPNDNGTTLSDTWTAGQNQTYQFTIPLPSYIANLGEIALIAFVQDDSNKDIKNAAFSPKQAVSGLADASIASINTSTNGYCDPNVTPSVVIKNSGTMTITTATVSYSINGGTPISQNWTGSLSAGQTATIAFPQATLSPGANDIVATVEYPNGSADYAPINNTSSPQTINILSSTPSPAPYIIDFEGLSFGEVPSNVIKENTPGTDPMVGGVSQANVGGWNTDLGGWGQSTNSMLWDFPTISSGVVTSIITEKISLSSISNPNLFLTTAYAARGGNTSDQLKVYVSTDCGSSWTSIFSPAGSALVTGTDPGSSNRFFPLPNQWLTHKVSLANYASANDIILKFEGTSGAGQVLWLDNIWVSTNVLSSDEDIISNRINVFPNPSSDIAKFDINLSNASSVVISIYNLAGQKVINLNSGILSSGNHILNIPVSDLPDGMYNAQVSIDGAIQTLRFAVAH